MHDHFKDRMSAQRAILKTINQVRWPAEDLFALSQDAIERWAASNRLSKDDSIFALAREAGDALLFLANASQEQVSPQYETWSNNLSSILNQLSMEIDTRAAATQTN
ncbi:MAG: hypothetical protein H6876_06215 [Hyphomicrobiaceae bacterium]|nr:hypothetical protein [Hyphomicrobiaceae bacterium]